MWWAQYLDPLAARPRHALVVNASLARAASFSGVAIARPAEDQVPNDPLGQQPGPCYESASPRLIVLGLVINPHDLGGGSGRDVIENAVRDMWS